MKFLISYAWKPSTTQRAEGFERFRKSGGATPAGTKLLGRWTRADLSGGVVVLESESQIALAEFAKGWSDLMELTTAPVVDDRELLEVLTRGDAAGAR